MKILNKRTVEETYVKDVTCDKCGLSMQDNIGNTEGLTTYVMCGYNSIIGDGSEFNVDICEKCLLVLFKDFKRNPLEQ